MLFRRSRETPPDNYKGPGNEREREGNEDNTNSKGENKNIPNLLEQSIVDRTLDSLLLPQLSPKEKKTFTYF